MEDLPSRLEGHARHLSRLRNGAGIEDRRQLLEGFSDHPQGAAQGRVGQTAPDADADAALALRPRHEGIGRGDGDVLLG